MRKIYLEEVLILTKKQGELLSYNDLKGFEEVLNAKQLIIEKLEELKEQKDLPITEEEREILLQIQALDAKNREIYSKELDNVKAELKNMRMLRAREVYFNKTYTTATEEGMFLDKKEYSR